MLCILLPSQGTMEGLQISVKLASASVSNRLAYCNSFFYYTDKAYTMHCVQNKQIQSRDTVLAHTKMSSYLVPCTVQRPPFYKATHFCQPLYLSSLFQKSNLTWGSRLSVSSTRPNKHMGLHSLRVAASKEWNKLPQAIRAV